MEALLEQRIQYLERLLSTKARSPIVVQLASLYLEAGRPHDALRYCDSAIANFPYYTTAHLIRAKVLFALEMRAEARREYEFVHSILPDVDSVKGMLDQLPASETETFEEPPEGGENGLSSLDQAPAHVEESPQSAESESSLLTEETQASDAVEIPDEVRSAGLEEATEAPTQPPMEEGQVSEDLPQSPSDEDPFGLGPIGEVKSVADEPAAPPQEEQDLGGVSSFADLGPAETVPPPAEEEVPSSTEDTFETFVAERRQMLEGTENTIGIEEFLRSRESQSAEPEESGNIEELTEKLQNAPRITPVIDITEKKTPPPSEEDTPASTGFVTPTLAEIYAKQGWYDDAIVAYKTLARIKPAERERFEKRIRELEDLKKSEEGNT